MIATTASGRLGDAAPQPDAAIDEDHLSRMTLGDVKLEREVLQIFVRQSVIMLERIAGSDPAMAAAAAHTLTGSARGIGAFRVAQAAERLERAASGNSDAVEFEQAVDELKAAAVEASAAIAARLSRGLRNG